jgi:hypothetical protein
MQEYKELSDRLSKNITLGKHRLNCLSSLVLGLIKVNTTNLKKLSVACDNGTKPASCYKRLQRFFSGVKIDFNQLSVFLVSMFFKPDERLCLALDRTNWKYGKQHINILVLSAAYRGVALPVMWVSLDKAGSSHTDERIPLLDRFISVFGAARIKSLLGDREFFGNKWFNYLQKHGIEYVIRIKSNTIVNNKGYQIHVSRLFNSLKVGEKMRLKHRRSILGLSVLLSAVRSPSGELVILATMDKKIDAVILYARRWEIETLFSCLKGRGFNFEDTRITAANRIDTMVAVLALAFAWSHRAGEWFDKNIDPIGIKKHGRLERSYFRCGLDMLQDSFFSPNKLKANFVFLLKLLETSASATLKKPLGLKM